MRYYWWTYKKKNGVFVQWKLLSEQTIESLTETLGDTNDCFKSIQSYDKEGSDKECPIYVDLDGSSAQADAFDLVEKIKTKLGVFPEIYDSGSKGLHLIVPVSIRHEKCELIVKNIITSLNPGKSWDQVVYKSRNMWRIDNTINTKGGRLKTQTNTREQKCDMSNIKLEELHLMIEIAKTKIRVDEVLAAEKTYTEATGNFETEMVPCIEDIIKNGTVDGKWNPSLVLVARFFRSCNTPKDEALDYLFQYSHLWYRRTALRNAFKSIYGSTNKATFGCRNECLLKEKCNKFLCVYSTEE